MIKPATPRGPFALGATASVLSAAVVAAILVACGGGGGGMSSSGNGGGGGGGNMCGGYLQPPCSGGGGSGFGGAGGGEYIANALVTDSGTGALHADADLVNGWGVAFNPSGYVWVADEGTGKSTLYDGDGVKQSSPIVTMQAGALHAANPSGIVYNGTSGFGITSGNLSGTPPFIFATLQGQIEAWSPTVNLNQAYSIVDNGAAGASYTGLAIGVDTSSADLLFAANFSQGRVDVFGATYAITTTAGGFSDPALPAGYAPFGIQSIGGSVYVAYAMFDDTTKQAQKGAGLGIVDVFDTQGTLVKRLVGPGGALDAPWGMAMAPANFGPLSGKLLVGNFGDGKINAFDPTTGALAGFVKNNDGTAIVVDGLWGIAFGNGLHDQPTNTLFYAAGPDDEQQGLYGRIDLN
jgi:uncharacterized protein (TIGR03118 family)